MKWVLTLLSTLTLGTIWAQKPEKDSANNYLSIRVGAVAPLGVLDDNYYGGLSASAIMHFKWLRKGAEVQLVSGYEYFLPKRGNIFGSISAIPVKVGILQMISKEFFLFGHTGIMFIKDEKSDYSIRFATDAGIGYAFKRFAVDVSFNGWLRNGTTRFSNFLAAGFTVPFRR